MTRPPNPRVAVGGRRLAHRPALDEPRGATGRQTELLCAAVVAVAGVLLMAARVPIAMRQLWAEDGAVFLQDALDHGPLEPFGSSHAGYFHFAPRLIGGVASLLPIRWAATVTWMLVAAFVAWCVATVFLEGRAWLRSPWARATLALGLVLLPAAGGESLGNAANLQFTLLFAALVVLIGVQRSQPSIVSGCALALVTGLTAALGVVLLPLVAWRIARDRRVDWVVAGWALGVGLQLAGTVFLGANRDASSALRTVPSTYVRALGGPILFAVAVLAVVAGVLLAWRARDWYLAALLVLVPATGAAIFVVSALRSLGPGLTVRYWLLPAWCVVWAALVSLELIADRIGGGGRSLLPLACAALLVFWLVGWSPSSWRSTGTSWHYEVDRAAEGCGDHVAVPVMPVAAPPATAWSVTVDCDRIGRPGR